MGVVWVVEAGVGVAVVCTTGAVTGATAGCTTGVVGVVGVVVGATTGATVGVVEVVGTVVVVGVVVLPTIGTVTPGLYFAYNSFICSCVIYL
jgi:hypothetical protein